MRHLFIILWLCIVCSAQAETISYEIFALGKDGVRKPLFKGIKEYSLKDIEVTESWWPGTKFWSKELLITNQFTVGASVHRETELVGFGIWMKRRSRWFEIWRDGGFSWEWFNRETPQIYRKLQGPGRVKVTTISGPGYVELTAIEFLDDVTLRLNDNPWYVFSDDETHHLVIGKGSVLRIAP